MELVKFTAGIAKIQELIEKAKLAAQIAKPLIDEVKDELKPLIDDIKANGGLFKRGKTIKALKLKSEQIEGVLASQIAINEAQQKQLDKQQEQIEQIAELVKDLAPAE